jgi:hypothetical protein
MFMMSHGSELFEAYIEGKSLICNEKGNSRASFKWIELTNGNDVVHDGHELTMCFAVSFQRWKQGTQKNEPDLELTFQCVAQQGIIVARLNYTVSASFIESTCSATSQATGARV